MKTPVSEEGPRAVVSGAPGQLPLQGAPGAPGSHGAVGRQPSARSPSGRACSVAGPAVLPAWGLLV